MARKSGLGKGLGALIPGDQPVIPDGTVLEIPIEEIQANPYQPRLEMNEKLLNELADSIREHGVLQPLVVTREEDHAGYTLIAGERRLRASKIAGLQTVPAIVRLASDQQRLELALIENVQRADLGPLETAEAYLRLSEEFGLSHDEIAVRVGKSRPAVTNALRLFQLPEAAKLALAKGLISEGHARALLQLKTAQAQSAVLQTILDQELSVRKTEELVHKYNGERAEKPLPQSRLPEIDALEARLRDRFGTRVTLNYGKRGGSVVIHYFSNEELDSLLKQLLDE
ncbi:MAG TPA: ParB/RepB/Spo0J family partition protein [Bellilinea sp.]|jgi:ParB family chromosome partitioning protein|nr:ParB/RepB/Spo0J family partition protein [Bellilinea sp.]